MQVPVDSEAGIKKRKVLSDKSNFSLDSMSTGGPPVSGVGKVSEYSWTDSILLKQVFMLIYPFLAPPFL